MDYRQFLAQLPNLYDDWKQETIAPKNQDFKQLFAQLGGMTTVNIFQLLNFAVECMGSGEVYCQVGGSATLVAAMHNHPQACAYVIAPQEISLLTAAISQFQLEERVGLFNQPFEQFIAEYRALELPERIGVLFYDGAADYRSVLMALLVVKPFLADQALIVVDDTNWTPVQQATWDFISTHPQCQLSLDFPTPADGYPTFWNGLRVMTWDCDRNYNYDWQTLNQFHNPDFVAEISRLPRQINGPQSNLSLSDYDPISLQNYYGNPAQAEKKYRDQVAKNPKDGLAYLDLSNTLALQGKINEAIAVLNQAIGVNPSFPDAYNNLSLLYEKKGEPAMAAMYMGHKFYYLQQYANAIERYEKFLETLYGNDIFYKTLADCYYNIGDYQNAFASYHKGLSLYPQSGQLYFWLCWALRDCGYLEESRFTAAQGALKIPGAGQLLYQANIFLPIIYESETEIDFIRDRYTRGLQALVDSIDISTPEGRDLGWNAISWSTNFYLQYQGRNDIHLQRQFGELMHRVLGAKYPDWVRDLPMPPLDKAGKIRIGYISAYLRWHTVCKLFSGWIRHADRQKFEIYIYYTDQHPDTMTEMVRELSDHFHHIYNDMPKLCQQILEDRLHILVYLDIGMYPLINLVSCLRLAPVQCMTWGHPITSGSPVMDYYLTSEWMEPEDADGHYTEKLIRLPHTSITYQKPDISYATMTRADFGFPEDKVLFLSCQSTFKYLPRHDYIFAEIAKRVPNCRIVFIESHAGKYMTMKFKARLQRAFDRVGLSVDDYCIMTGRQGAVGYMSLNRVCDVFLDSLAWSGGNTTMEAIACGLPVVTCPTGFMRGRHTYAILKTMGITETIARSEAEYIEIAARLGLDPQWRSRVVERFAEAQDRLYEDTTPIPVLESFYEQVVRERLYR